MRKALQAPKLRNDNGGIPSNSYEASQQHEEYDSSLGFMGNPLYSPEEANLAKAASKLENLHQKSISHVKNKAAATTPEAAGKLSKTALGDQIPAHKPLPSEVATPGWRPAAQSKVAAADDIPLAARTLMAKRNSRKSVFQRPTRYGDWFDGDDDELEEMVDEFNGDKEAAREAHDEAQRKGEKMEGGRPGPTRRSKQAALPATSEEGERERTGTPLAASSGVPLVSPTDLGTDIANKVRAIADGLCERLDGLIEESPALPRGAKRDDKSLRDKLLESWEGRSYYERLMQMAGGSAEQEDLQAELEAAKAENSMDSSTMGSDKEGSAAPGEQKPAAPTHALSFLSPPKPKMRMELAAALQRPLLPLAKDLVAPKVGLPAAPAPAAVVAPPITTAQPGKVSPVSIVNTTSQAPPPKLQLQLPQQQPQQNVLQQHTRDISRGLLKVSARGSKPMPAPWQQGNGDDAAGTAAPVASAPPCGDLAARIIQEDKVEEKKEEKMEDDVEEKTVTENKDDAVLLELQSLRAALAEMTLAKQAAEKQAEDAKKALSKMEMQLEEVEEDLKTEAAIRAAAEKRIHSLETEIATLQASSADAGGCQGTVLGKIVEDATEVNGCFGLVETQLEALLTAANALSQQVSSGRVLAQTLVNNVTAAQAAAAQAGEEGKTRITRARRKSAWRG